jgi:hypothetical protein
MREHMALFHELGARSGFGRNKVSERERCVREKKDRRK